MSAQVPHFDNDKLAEIALTLYGIKGDITQLVSFEDQNARIKTPTDTYVMKVANARIKTSVLDMQTDILKHIHKTAPDIAVPQVLETKGGNTITDIDGHSVRMLTYIEGDLLTNAKRTPALYHNIGNFMGRYSRAMQGYTHPAGHIEGDLWNMDNMMGCKELLGDVIDPKVRQLLARFYDIYEQETLSKVSSLRKGILHNDANEQNLLISTSNPNIVAGVIDFGEIQYASQINEIAITTAYSLLDEPDIQMAAHAIVKGYRQEFELEEIELEILPNLIAMRMVQSISLSSHWAKSSPDNDYITIVQKPAIALLRHLEKESLTFQC